MVSAKALTENWLQLWIASGLEWTRGNGRPMAVDSNRTETHIKCFRYTKNELLFCVILQQKRQINGILGLSAGLCAQHWLIVVSCLPNIYRIAYIRLKHEWQPNITAFARNTSNTCEGEDSARSPRNREFVTQL